MEKGNKKGLLIGIIVALVIVLVVVLIGGIWVGYYFYKKAQKQVNETVNTSEKIVAPKSNEPVLPEKNNYGNSVYGYTFSYPISWQQGQSDDDYLVLLDNTDQLTFEFRSGAMTAFGLEEYEVVDQKNIIVGGVLAEEKFLTSPGGGRMIYVSFEKNGVQHLVAIYYPEIYNQGEKVFNEVLKSIKFE